VTDELLLIYQLTNDDLVLLDFGTYDEMLGNI
jgi:hypothetical protein